MLISGKQAFVGGVKYDSPQNDCVGGYACCGQVCDFLRTLGKTSLKTEFKVNFSTNTQIFLILIG